MNSSLPTPPRAVNLPHPEERPGLRAFFENHWEKMVLWAFLIGLFYLLKPFLLLIFETFLITYITKGLVFWLVKRLKLNYRLTTTLVFLLFVGLLATIGAWVGPKLVIESNAVIAQFAGADEQPAGEKINRLTETIVTQVFGKEKAQLVMGSIEYTALMKTMKLEASRIMSAALPKVLEWLFFIVKLGWKILMSLVLAVIFSFILVFDWQRIAAAVKSLEQSRIRTFYHDTAPHLVAFANVLGRAFRAQVLVAVCNTTLTAAGLWFFDVPNITLLATIVFICGFIPILGTFLSSIPIMLFALPVGGLLLVLKLILLIAVVHALEAYVLNPRITANILHIHPILVLILLLLGERFCGLWGMVLGVPIGYYVISVLAHRDESLPAEDPERPPAA